jgi:hypothetical protein
LSNLAQTIESESGALALNDDGDAIRALVDLDWGEARAFGVVDVAGNPSRVLAYARQVAAIGPPAPSLEMAIAAFEMAERNLCRALARRVPSSVLMEYSRQVVREWLPELDRMLMLVPDIVRVRLDACWAEEVLRNTPDTKAAVLVTVVHTTLPLDKQNQWNAPPPRWHTDDAGALAGPDDHLIDGLMAVQGVPGSYTHLEFGQRSPEAPSGSGSWVWRSGERVIV